MILREQNRSSIRFHSGDATHPRTVTYLGPAPTRDEAAGELRAIGKLPKSKRNPHGALRMIDEDRANYLGALLDTYNSGRSARGPHDLGDAEMPGIPTFEEAQEELRRLTEQDDLTDHEETRLAWLSDVVEKYRSSRRSPTQERARAMIDADEPPRSRSNGGRSSYATSSGADLSDIRSATSGELRDRALRLLEERGRTLAPRQQDDVDRLLRSNTHLVDGGAIARRLIVTESPGYRSAFAKAMVQPHPVFTEEESRAVNAYRQECRAMNEGTGADGGYGVPVLIDPTIILSSGALDSPVLKICTIKTITTDAWHGVSAPAATWQYTAEAAVVTDGSPTMVQPTIPVYKADGYIPYSVEVEQDYPGFAEEMAKLLAQGYLDLMAPTLCTGSGSSQPTGIFTGMANITTNPAHVTVTTAGTLSAIDVRTAWKSLPELFRPNASWLMHIEVQNLIQAFGNNLALADFSTNIASDGTTILEGKPVLITDYAPQFTNTTGTETVLVVGDFSRYIFVQRAGMTVEQVPQIFDSSTQRPTGQRGWYAWARNGAGIAAPNSFRILSNS
ncbi:MAG: phage major capsid protein [Acidimicrobiales bacterium]